MPLDDYVNLWEAIMRIFLFTIVAIVMLGGFFHTEARTDETLRIHIGQQRSADHGKIKIKFISVLEDSRCPMNARCVWAGNAKIKIAVSKGRASKTVELNTGTEPLIVTVFGYKLTLEDLAPHKGEPKKPLSRSKTATITVAP